MLLIPKTWLLSYKKTLTSGTIAVNANTNLKWLDFSLTKWLFISFILPTHTSEVA